MITRFAPAFAISLTFALLTAASAGAGTLHVAPDGDDANPGSKDKPLKTLTAAAGKLQPGDICLVAPGVYRGPVTPVGSGTKDKPIVFRAAQPGASGVITGQNVTGWQKHKGHIWKAKVDHQPRQVFFNGRPLTLARTPNASDSPWNPRVMKMTRTDKTLGSVDALKNDPRNAWKGSRLWVIDDRKQWVAEMYTIQASDGGKLTLDRPKGWWGKGTTGLGYLFGSMRSLDAPGEWVAEDGWLYVWLPGNAFPNGRRILSSTDTPAFDLTGRSHIKLDGFRLFGCSIDFDGAEHCTASRIQARYVSSGWDLQSGFCRDHGINRKSPGLGIILGGENNTLEDSEIAYSAGDGVSIYGKNNTVRNCIIRDCDTSGTDCAPITATGRGHTIERNTLYNGGRSIVVHRKFVKGRIAHNRMYNAGLLCRDLGMTYTYQTDGEGTEIAYNIIHHNFAPGNGGCVGIYLDDWSRNHTVHHNVVYQVNEALAMNPPKSRHNKIYNNTLWGFSRSLSMSLKRPQDMTGTIVRNNLFLAPIMDEKHMPNITIDTNMIEPPLSMFVDAKDYDLQLTKGAAAIDAGKKLPPWTKGFVGDAPDLGAYEYGKEPWTAGSTLREPEGVRDIDLEGNRKRPWEIVEKVE